MVQLNTGDGKPVRTLKIFTTPTTGSEAKPFVDRLIALFQDIVGLETPSLLDHCFITQELPGGGGGGGGGGVGVGGAGARWSPFSDMRPATYRQGITAEILPRIRPIVLIAPQTNPFLCVIEIKPVHHLSSSAGLFVEASSLDAFHGWKAGLCK